MGREKGKFMKIGYVVFLLRKVNNIIILYMIKKVIFYLFNENLWIFIIYVCIYMLFICRRIFTLIYIYSLESISFFIGRCVKFLKIFEMCCVVIIKL